MDNSELTEKQRAEIHEHFVRCFHIIGWSTLPDYYLPRKPLKGNFAEVRDKYFNEGTMKTGNQPAMYIWLLKRRFTKEV